MSFSVFFRVRLRERGKETEERREMVLLVNAIMGAMKWNTLNVIR